MNGNRYLTRASDGNGIFLTATGNVHVDSWVLFLVTVLFLDSVMIQWIHWKSFRENSNEIGTNWYRLNSVVNNCPGETPLSNQSAEYFHLQRNQSGKYYHSSITIQEKIVSSK